MNDKTIFDNQFKDAMDKYFNKKNKNTATNHENNVVINEQIPEHSSLEQMTAEGNISTISEAVNLISKLLNAAWGSKWGAITDSISRGGDPNKITTPLITYDTNFREVSPGTNVKPQQMNIKNEVVNNKNTGDAFKVYRQFFDTIVEFNFYDASASTTDKLMCKFEDLILTYAGYLKKNGIKEIYFLKEIPATYSLNYIQDVPMKCLLYYIQLERVHTVRVSTIHRIEESLQLNINKPAPNKATEVLVNNIVYKGDK